MSPFPWRFLDDDVNFDEVIMRMRMEKDSDMEIAFTLQVLNTDNSQLAKVCGSTKPEVLQSTGSKMTVVFHRSNDDGQLSTDYYVKKLSELDDDYI